ncbi:MAG: hypothetical protein DBY37_12060 [Desulfovibrionaceae bacterium]|nr:MAG: hypothetical protein DBY37_12060 [Desulfovibrionaceae bacterium]
MFVRGCESRSRPRHDRRGLVKFSQSEVHAAIISRRKPGQGQGASETVLVFLRIMPYDSESFPLVEFIFGKNCLDRGGA